MRLSIYLVYCQLLSRIFELHRLSDKRTVSQKSGILRNPCKCAPVMPSVHVQSFVLKPLGLRIPIIPVSVDRMVYFSFFLNFPSPGAVDSMITICEAAHEVVLPPGQAHRLHVVIPERGPCLIAPARLGVKVHVVDIVGV